MPESELGEFSSGLDLEWYVDTNLESILQEFVEGRNLDWDLWKADYLPYFAEYDTTEEEMINIQYALDTDIANMQLVSDLDQVDVNTGAGSFVGNYNTIESDERIQRLHNWEQLDRMLEREVKEYKLQKAWESDLYSQIVSMADADIFINEAEGGGD